MCRKVGLELAFEEIQNNRWKFSVKNSLDTTNTCASECFSALIWCNRHTTTRHEREWEKIFVESREREREAKVSTFSSLHYNMERFSRELCFTFSSNLNDWVGIFFNDNAHWQKTRLWARSFENYMKTRKMDEFSRKIFLMCFFPFSFPHVSAGMTLQKSFESDFFFQHFNFRLNFPESKLMARTHEENV